MQKRNIKMVYNSLHTYICIINIIFFYISSMAVNGLNLVLAVIILLLVIFIGILFDIIGVAVTVGDEHDFHAKATKKSKRLKNGIKTYKTLKKSS